MKSKRIFRWGLLFTFLLLVAGLIINDMQNVASAVPGEKNIPTVVNGITISTLGGLIDMLKANPDKGRVTFYSNSKWQSGMRSFSTFTGYKIDGKMYHEKKRNFVLLGDEGTELSRTDAAPGAVEELMYALGTCIIAAANANAALISPKIFLCNSFGNDYTFPLL